MELVHNILFISAAKQMRYRLSHFQNLWTILGVRIFLSRNIDSVREGVTERGC
jgi:hypothetical protein